MADTEHWHLLTLDSMGEVIAHRIYTGDRKHVPQMDQGYGWTRVDCSNPLCFGLLTIARNLTPSK